jgi:hypothetical protein
MMSCCLLLLLVTGFGLENVADAAQPSLSGSFTSSYVDNSFGKNVGNGTFIVSYSFPSTLRLGSNLTGQVSLQISELNGLQTFVEVYQVTVQVAVPSGQGASAVVGGSSPLYPGAIWGPKNVTIPVTQQNMGTIAGSVNASVNISLATTVLATVIGNGPGTLERVHGASQFVGNIAIEAGATSVGTSGGSPSNGSGAGILPYIIVGAGVVVVSVGILSPRLFPQKRGQ